MPALIGIGFELRSEVELEVRIRDVSGAETGREEEEEGGEGRTDANARMGTTLLRRSAREEESGLAEMRRTLVDASILPCSFLSPPRRVRSNEEWWTRSRWKAQPRAVE